MGLKILAGSANLTLAAKIAAQIGIALTRRTLERFPDGELHIELEESVHGDDVFLIQPTTPPVDEHLFELFLLADACRRAGAAHLTAVVPYFGYARQDRRAHGREPLSARVIAELLEATGIQRLIAVDLHSRAVESAFRIPMEQLSAISILAEAVRSSLEQDTVVVSPDLGAVKMAEQYAKLFKVPVAIIHKTRLSGEEVSVERIVGDVCNKQIVLIDDMISTGGTIAKAIDALLDAGCSRTGIKVLATHGLLVGRAAERLERCSIGKIYLSDSVAGPEAFPIPLEYASLAPMLAEAIKRLHTGQPVASLIRR